MRHTAVRTDAGPVWFSADPLDAGPAVFLLHGAMRSTDDLAAVSGRIPNSVLGHLPGHGVEDLSVVSLDVWSRAFATAADAHFGSRPVILVGESLGALVCLAMACLPVRSFRAVVAVEPPLTYSWPLAASPLSVQLRAILSADRRGLLARSRVPVTVVCGDVPREPPRPLERAPSLLSEEDRGLANDLRVVTGGHEVMSENPTACASAIAEAVQRFAL